MLLHFLLAMLAFALTALSAESASVCHATITSFVTIPGPTVTLPGVTVTFCPGTSVSTSATSRISTSSTSISCPTDAYLMNVSDGTTYWPCGTPDPTETLTTLSSPSIVTVQQPTPTSSEELTTTVYGTVTLTTTSTMDSSEAVTTVVVTTWTTVSAGTTSTTDPTPELTTPTQSPLPSSFTGLGSQGWNMSTPATTSYTVKTHSHSHVTSTVHLTRSTTTTVTIHNSTMTWHGVSSATPFVTLNGTSHFTTVPPVFSSSTQVGGSTADPFMTSNITVNGTILTPVLPSSHATSSNFSISLMFPPATASTPTSTVNATTTADMPTPTKCHEDGVYAGFFILKWDDEPKWTPPKNETYKFPPVFSPYHHLMFANGYTYVPESVARTSPITSPYMAMYLPNLTTSALDHPEAGVLPRGGIGAGSRASNPAFWFNAHNGFFSCDQGPEGWDAVVPRVKCNIQVTGFRWSEEHQKEMVHCVKTFEIPACWSLNKDNKCDLEWVDFSSKEGDLRNLSSIRIHAFYWEDKADDRIFVMDNMQLSWADKSCAAVRARANDKL